MEYFYSKRGISPNLGHIPYFLPKSGHPRQIVVCMGFSLKGWGRGLFSPEPGIFGIFAQLGALEFFVIVGSLRCNLHEMGASPILKYVRMRFQNLLTTFCESLGALALSRNVT